MSTKKIHRFIGNYQLGEGNMRIDDGELAHQMRSVLKLEPGEIVIIGDGSGLEAHCRILSYDRAAVVLEGMSLGRNTAELALRTTLYCAVLKADHFELAAAKATEIGISEVVPLITKRTVKLNLRLDRVEKIVREAAELSGRGIVPAVMPVQNFEDAITRASHHDVNFFFDASGASFAGAAKSVRTAGIFIGPEGGWDEAEIQEAERAGMRMVSLGNFTLRAETAVIVASYMVAHSLKS
jgi:16S rRNA (uracil1498-N3)-methyltransferase